MKLRLLDKYVLKELLGPFLFGVCAFSSIFVASTMLFRLTMFMTKYGASLETIARLFFYELPEIVNYTFPMSMLLAALMAFGKLSGSSEIVAMKASGVSYYRIVAPVMVVGFVISMFSVIWAEKVVPMCKVKAENVIYYEIKHNTRPQSASDVVIKTFGGSTQRITYARSFEEKNGVLTKVTITEYEDGRPVRMQVAPEGKWKNGNWYLYNGKVFTLDQSGKGVQSSADFKEQVIPLDVAPRVVTWQQKDAEQMTIAELREYVNILEKQGRPTAEQWSEIYMRISIPLASFFFAIIGAALGTQKQRTSSSIGLGISVLVIFIYYAVMTLTTGLGKGGVLPPLLACSLPNILCLIIGSYLLKKKNA